MITEDFVSYETAKLLREKGFDETVRCFYDIQTEILCDNCVRTKNSYTESIAAPTLQMAMKWLREVHHIAISVYVFNRDVPLKEDNIIYTCDIATANMSSKEGHLRLVGPYEEACEAAIKYCLENLI